MFFKFNDASEIFNEITNLMSLLEERGESPNYILLYTEFSKYSFLKSNYEEVSISIEISCNIAFFFTSIGCYSLTDG